MAVIFIIALTTRMITNRSKANTNCYPAIDSTLTVVEHADSIKIFQKNL
jgi:hypothetical protein